MVRSGEIEGSVVRMTMSFGRMGRGFGWRARRWMLVVCLVGGVLVSGGGGRAGATLSSNPARVSLKTAGGQVNGGNVSYLGVNGDGITQGRVTGVVSGNPVVGFTSHGIGLTSESDTNLADDVFVRDTTGLGSTALVSVSLLGVTGSGASTSPSVSGDARFVAFQSAATNLTSDVPTVGEVYIRDRTSATTSMASRAAGSGGAIGAGGASSNPVISADGTGVGFVSKANNLVSGSTSTHFQVFLRVTSGTPTTTRLSDASGTEGNGDSDAPSVSADGKVVAFRSTSTNLGFCGNAQADIFVWDNSAGTPALGCASLSSGGVQAGAGSDHPSLSSDGRWLAFDSAATNLVAVAAGGVKQVFVRDRKRGVTIIASLSDAEAVGGADSYAPSISDDGRYVSFLTNATNLLPAGSTVPAVVVRDLWAGKTTPLVTSTGGSTLPNGAADFPSLSADGRWLAVGSVATNLLPVLAPDTNGVKDAFVRDRLLGVAGSNVATPSGLSGGGLENVIAETADSSVLLAGGDTSGLHRSTSLGDVWVPANSGLGLGEGGSPNFNDKGWQLKIAAVSFQTTSTVYGLAGLGLTSNSALLQSTDGGVTWVVASSGLFAVNGTSSGQTHPRATGRLLGIDAGTQTLVYGATNSGLLRFNPAGPTTSVFSLWTGTVPTAGGLALDGLQASGGNITRAYVAVRDTTSGSGSQRGIIQVDAINTTPTVSAALRPACLDLTDSLAQPQEVWSVTEGGTTSVYVAFGSAGIFRYKPNTGLWVTIASPIAGCAGGISPSTTPAWPAVNDVTSWSSLDGYKILGGTNYTILAVGGVACDVLTTCGDVDVATVHPAVWLIKVVTSSGAVVLTDTTGPITTNTPNNVNTPINGPNGEPWWHTRTDVASPLVAHQEAALSHKQWITGQVLVDPNNTARIFVAGRGGVWRGTQTGGVWSWYPVVQGLGSSVARDVAVEPVTASQQVAEADVDWTTTLSPTHFEDGPAAEEPNSKPAYAISFDRSTTPPALVAGGGKAAPLHDMGWVSRNANPFDPTSPWVSLPTPPISRQVIGIAAGTSGSQPTVVIVVAEDTAGRGVYRSTFNGTAWGGWVAATLSPVLNIGIDARSSKVDTWWPPGGSTLYVFDPKTGIWRSPDGGITFTRLWMAITDENVDHAGKMAGDPSSPNRLYFTTRTHLYVIDNASSCAPCTPNTDLMGGVLPRPGAVAVAPDGTAYVTQLRRRRWLGARSPCSVAPR